MVRNVAKSVGKIILIEHQKRPPNRHNENIVQVSKENLHVVSIMDFSQQQRPKIESNSPFRLR